MCLEPSCQLTDAYIRKLDNRRKLSNQAINSYRCTSQQTGACLLHRGVDLKVQHTKYKSPPTANNPSLHLSHQNVALDPVKQAISSWVKQSCTTIYSAKAVGVILLTFVWLKTVNIKLHRHCGNSAKSSEGESSKHIDKISIRNREQ